ncbi:MAG: KH domain-containing protein [Clostridia bacterium]
MYKNLLEYIVKNLVNNPQDVEIDEIDTDTKLTLELKVNKEDMGRVIGKEGRIIRSIREIIYAYAMKDAKKVLVEVKESTKDVPEEEIIKDEEQDINE